MRFVPSHEKLHVGQERIISKFLLFPTKIGIETRWLERAYIRQKVIDMDVGGSMQWGHYKKTWVNVEFIDD
jgi:hypothetical protein